MALDNIGEVVSQGSDTQINTGAKNINIGGIGSSFPFKKNNSNTQLLLIGGATVIVFYLMLKRRK